MKWKLVPVEPDDEQRESGHRTAWQYIPSLFDESDAANVYRAMLEAAPNPPALSDEQILEIHNSMFPEPFRASERANVCQFTRAIERKILGRL